MPPGLPLERKSSNIKRAERRQTADIRLWFSHRRNDGTRSAQSSAVPDSPLL